MNSFLAIWCAFICFTTTIAFVKNDTKLWSHTFEVNEKLYLLGSVKVSIRVIYIYL
ncbi:unnamed protein product [Psylliodes chrysocephalus]|uniref:ATP synthase F0 subunit 8 n=1 Tax=Psylliodes chrysocephalus TaxID=3402493 RepID=A0A9P0D2K8_9CUCU|nr:unnamed protein product [Psylliodes chrysocephala]